MKKLLFAVAIAIALSAVAAVGAPAQEGGASCLGAPATIVGDGSSTIYGTPGPDVIVGTSANETIYGLGGDDLICGGLGDDTIFGGDGNDTLVGDTGESLPPPLKSD